MVEPNSSEDNGKRRRAADPPPAPPQALTDALLVPLIQRLERATQDALELAASRTDLAIEDLRRYYDIVLSERDLRYEERFTSSQLALREANANSKEAVAAAFEAAKEAVLKSEVGQEKRNDATFVTVQRQAERLDLLLPRLEAEARFKDHDRRFDELTTTLGNLTTSVATGTSGTEARREGGTEMRTAIFGFIGVVVALISIIIFLAARVG